MYWTWCIYNSHNGAKKKSALFRTEYIMILNIIMFEVNERCVQIHNYESQIEFYVRNKRIAITIENFARQQEPREGGWECEKRGRRWKTTLSLHIHRSIICSLPHFLLPACSSSCFVYFSHKYDKIKYYWLFYYEVNWIISLIPKSSAHIAHT